MNIRNLFQTIDTHVLGEAFRIIVQSPISLTAAALSEKEQQLEEQYPTVKQLLLNEPRGHRGINGCVILPSAVASYELLFLNHAGAAIFKYEAVIASLAAMLETGNLQQTTDDKYIVATSFGEVKLQAKLHNHQVTSIQLEAFKAQTIESDPHLPVISVDKTRNYGITGLPKEIPAIALDHLGILESWGADAWQTYAQKGGKLEGIILAQQVGESHFSTVTYEKDGYIRRTPGIDTSAVLMEAFHKNLTVEMPVKNETVFGSVLDVLPQTTKNCFEVRPFITGSQEFILDADDPLPTGFLLQ